MARRFWPIRNALNRNVVNASDTTLGFAWPTSGCNNASERSTLWNVVIGGFSGAFTEIYMMRSLERWSFGFYPPDEPVPSNELQIRQLTNQFLAKTIRSTFGLLP